MKKILVLLLVFASLASAQFLGPPSGYKDTVSVGDSAKMIWQIGPPWSPVKIRSQNMANLIAEIGGGGGSGCPTGGDCTLDSLYALAARVKDMTIDTLNKNKDTIFAPRPIILWNRLAGRTDSANQRDWALITNGTISAYGHIDTYLSGQVYPWGPDSGLRAYQRLAFGWPRPDSAIGTHAIRAEASGGYKSIPIVFYMVKEGTPTPKLEIDTLNQALGWLKNYGSIYTRNKMIITPDFGGGSQPIIVNGNSIFEVNTDSGSVHATLISHSASIGGSNQVTGYGTGGTRVSPSATTNGQQISGIFGRGWANGGYTTLSAAGMSVVADRDWTGSSQGAYLRMHITDSGSTTSYIAGQYYRGNLFVGNTSIVTGGKQNLVLVNTATAPTIITDRAALYAQDISAGNAALAVYQEAPVSAGAAVASTNKWPVIINGTTYYILMTTVP